MEYIHWFYGRFHETHGRVCMNCRGGILGLEPYFYDDFYETHGRMCTKRSLETLGGVCLLIFPQKKTQKIINQDMVKPTKKLPYLV